MSPQTRPDVWRRLEMLFQAAAEIDPAERSVFLDEVCAGDPDLRRRVESLLAAADRTFGCVERSVSQAAHELIAGGSVEGGRVGEYVLVRALGAGGMGSVYLAHRADGQFEQTVAVRQLHATLSQSVGIISRSRTERQILAKLEHPNIARLIGGGITTDGLPYLVMEYVDGISIIEYCRRNKLTLENKLALFQTVCGAVAYAHSHLIVHRDIKPGNILVTVDGNLKLLDFGIAKLLDAEVRAGDRTAATERLMTPDYASPEQIAGDPVTTGTDVYALGALLYEMLAGVRPFGRDTSDPVEIARRICSETPAAPSAAAERNPEIGPREALKIKGDLDNLVMTCMRKEPARRYVSVGQLSSDVQAYLDGSPLLAAPDSWRYRASKFVRRHKTGVTLSVIMALMLAGFSTGMGLLARRAIREQLKSDQQAQFMAAMFQAATPEGAKGRTITARDLLDRGARRVDRDLAAQPDVHAAMLDSIATAYRSLGMFDQAQSMMQRSYELKKRVYGNEAASTLQSLDVLAELHRDQGQWGQAEASLRQVLATRERRGSRSDPLLVDTLGELGECLYWEGKLAEAEPILRRGLALDRKLGGTHGGADVRNYLALAVERHSSFAEALQLLREAAELDRRNNGPESPAYTRTLHNLSSALIDAGDLQGAEVKLSETAAIRRKILGNEHPELALTLNNLAYVLLEEGKDHEAAPVVDETMCIWKKNYGELHYRVALAYGKLGRLNEHEDRFDAAERDYRTALDLFKKTNSPKWMSAGTLDSLSELELDRRNYPAAERLAQQALALLREAGRDDDPLVSGVLIDAGLARELSGHAAEAEPLFRRALELRQAKLQPDHPAVIAAEVRVGEALTDSGRAVEAEPMLAHAAAVAHNPPVPLLAWQVAEAEQALGACLTALGRSNEGSALLDRSRQGLKSHPRAAIRDRDYSYK